MAHDAYERQRAALDRLHHGVRHPVPLGDLDIEARGDVGIVVPVGIVHLQLDEVDVGVLGKQALEALGTRMEREAPVADDALLLEAADPVPQAVVVIGLLVVVLHGMQQVVVEVVGAQALQARLELPLDLLGRGVAEPRVGLAAQGVAVARVALDQRLARGLLGAGVDVGRVKVGEARVQEAVHHVADLRHVDGAVLQLGQAHEAKAQLGRVVAKVVGGVGHGISSQRNPC